MSIKLSEQSVFIKLIVIIAALFLIASSFGAQHISAASGHHNTSNLSLCAASCETPARRQETNLESKQRTYRRTDFSRASAQHEKYSIELLAELSKSDRPRIVDKVPIYKQVAVYLN